MEIDGYFISNMPAVEVGGVCIGICPSSTVQLLSAITTDGVHPPYNHLCSTGSEKPCKEGFQGVLLGVGRSDHGYDRLRHCNVD